MSATITEGNPSSAAQEWDAAVRSRSTRELKSRLGHYINTNGMERRDIIAELGKRWGDWFPSEWKEKTS